MGIGKFFAAMFVGPPDRSIEETHDHKFRIKYEGKESLYYSTEIFNSREEAHAFMTRGPVYEEFVTGVGRTAF